MMRYVYIAFFCGLVGAVYGQSPMIYDYSPQAMQGKEWKYAGQLYFSETSGSNVFTNNFLSQVNQSTYLDQSLIKKQLDQLSGNALAGTIRNFGGDLFIRDKKRFYSVGINHQYLLDAKVDKDLLQLLLRGNRPFAGQTLQASATSYYSLYFTQLRLGMGFEFGSTDALHTFSVGVGVNAGQNYTELNLNNSSFYTHPDGDFLDVKLMAVTRMSDTVWAKFSEFKGLGASADLFYSFQKQDNFYLAASVKNLGFIRWAASPFVSSVDTAFVFEGIQMDTTQSGNELPDNFSYDNLRRIIFKNPDHLPFNSSLPVLISATAGKFFSGSRYYAGIKADLQPTLEATYNLEFFFTYNMKKVLAITPLVSYGSFEHLNLGLAVHVAAGDHFSILAGSRYLNTLFNKEAIAGSGGFVRLVVFL